MVIHGGRFCDIPKVEIGPSCFRVLTTGHGKWQMCESTNLLGKIFLLYCQFGGGGAGKMLLRNHQKMRHAYFQELNQFHCVVEPNSCLSPGLEQNMCRNTNGTCSYAINFPKQKLCQALLHTRVYEEAIHSLQNNGPNSAFGPGQQKLALLCV